MAAGPRRVLAEKVARLERVESALLAAQVELPKLLREVRDARVSVQGALRAREAAEAPPGGSTAR